MRSVVAICIALSAFILGACGPAKVNLFAVKAGFDRHKATIDDAQAQYDLRRAELAEILAATDLDQSSPYSDLRNEVDSMVASIKGMRAASAKIDAFKPKFDAYAQGKSIVSEEDQAAWAEYQGVMAEYNALVGELNYQGSSFNGATRRYAELIKANKIEKLEMNALREELRSIAEDVEHGCADMEGAYPADQHALEVARNAGGDPEIIGQKLVLLTQMDRLLPGVKVTRSSMGTLKDFALRRLPSSGSFWTGPGMDDKKFSMVEDFRKMQAQYRDIRKSWDGLQAEFDAAAKPTPTPAPTPAP